MGAFSFWPSVGRSGVAGVAVAAPRPPLAAGTEAQLSLLRFTARGRALRLRRERQIAVCARARTLVNRTQQAKPMGAGKNGLGGKLA